MVRHWTVGPDIRLFVVGSSCFGDRSPQQSDDKLTNIDILANVVLTETDLHCRLSRAHSSASIRGLILNRPLAFPRLSIHPSTRLRTSGLKRSEVVDLANKNDLFSFLDEDVTSWIFPEFFPRIWKLTEGSFPVVRCSLESDNQQHIIVKVSNSQHC